MGINFLGYNLFDGDVARCADEMVEAACSNAFDCPIMSCINPHSYVVARTDAVFKAALSRSRWLIPDGSGILLGARLLQLPIRERVTGPDVFLAVMDRLKEKRGSVFFLGSSVETLAIIEERIHRDYPRIVLAGTYSPPFSLEFTEAENDAIIAAVNSARPDVLWVGITAPKQEKWLDAHRDRLEVGAAGAVGAAFDFFAGTVRRPPEIFRRAGLEWLLRLVQQPRRLWRRMGISAPIFLVDVVRAKIHGMQGPPSPRNNHPR